jgi:hypothetical protein
MLLVEAGQSFVPASHIIGSYVQLPLSFAKSVELLNLGIKCPQRSE